MAKKADRESSPVRNSTSGDRRRKETISRKARGNRHPATTPEFSNGARAFALAAAQLAAGRHCSDIVVLDLKGKSPATDYFVIATGTSDRQMRTVADEICETAKKQGLQRFGRAGYEQARWILLDFIDVVIHIFDSEYRDYYDLELLWGDAKRLTIDD